jgi:hypothetical protein
LLPFSVDVEYGELSSDGAGLKHLIGCYYSTVVVVVVDGPLFGGALLWRP